MYFHQYADEKLGDSFIIIYPVRPFVIKGFLEDKKKKRKKYRIVHSAENDNVQMNFCNCSNEKRDSLSLS